MCDVNCVAFAESQFVAHAIRGRDILEVGACDVNGSVRSAAARSEPANYVGVDIASGPGVDVVCSASDLIERFGNDAFDVVVSTEMLEHVPDWKRAVDQIKGVLRPGGLLILTTRSPGFPLHGYPFDFWRFTAVNMETIFADFDDTELVSDDAHSPGIFFAGTKAAGRERVILESLEVYSVVRRCPRRRATSFDVVASRLIIVGSRMAYTIARGAVPPRARPHVRRLVAARPASRRQPAGDEK